LLTFEEFLNFEILMTGPEADYRIAFEMFDSDKNGMITLDEFRNVIQTTRFSRDLRFDINCEWVRKFFGTEGKNKIDYYEFTQLLKGLEGEVLTQVFNRYAKQDNHKTVISSKDFENILSSGPGLTGYFFW